MISDARRFPGTHKGNHMHDNLGKTFKDKITGFSGVCTARAEYLTGCDQLLLAPSQRKPDGEVIDSRWFDVQRCEVCAEVERVTLDNGTTPGCDKPAPKR